MKKIILISLVLCLMAGSAYAGAVAGFDNSDTDVALAGGDGPVCISAVNFNATNATGDVTFYRFVGGKGNQTEFSADEAAAQTLLSTVYESGIATNAVVALVRADGSLAEIKTLTANATTGVLTSPAIDYAYKDGDKVYEMETLFTWADVGTDAVTVSNDNGLFCVPRGPVGFVITGGTAGYISGFTK